MTKAEEKHCCVAINAIIQVLEFSNYNPATLNINDVQVRQNIANTMTSVMSQDPVTRASNIQRYQLRTEDETAADHVEYLYQEWSNRHGYLY